MQKQGHLHLHLGLLESFPLFSDHFREKGAAMYNLRPADSTQEQWRARAEAG